jgi:sugar phosphate isomerase/epimerase
MQKPLVAVQMIVFYDEVLKHGYEKVLRFIKELGVNEIELSKVPVNRDTMPEIEKLCQELGLHACAMNAGFDPTTDGTLNVTDNLDELAEYANRLNCGYVRIGSLPSWVYGKEEAHYRYAEKLEGFGKRFASHGVKFYHHHHEFEFQLYGDKYGFEILMENTSPQYVGFEMDTHWLQYAGHNPVAWIRRMKGRADLVHLKDYRIVMPPEGVTGEVTSPKELRKKDVQFAEIGTGSLDMPEIINTCIETGVKYMPIEQDTPYDLSPYDSIRISVENIRKMGFADCF